MDITPQDVQTVSLADLARRRVELAREHYERLGYKIAAQGYRTRFGTIALIARDHANGGTLVFVNVAGHPAIRNPASDTTIRRKAAAWLAGMHYRADANVIRFDHVHVDVDAQLRLVLLDHIEDAF